MYLCVAGWKYNYMEFYLEYCYAVYQSRNGNSYNPQSYFIYLIAFSRISAYNSWFRKVELHKIILYIYTYLYIYNQAYLMLCVVYI